LCPLLRATCPPAVPHELIHSSLFARSEMQAEGAARYVPIVNATVAIVLSHMMAILPPALVMSTKSHVSCSTANGSVDTVIAARTTSLSGV
jgi:hypothetical protein